MISIATNRIQRCDDERTLGTCWHFDILLCPSFCGQVYAYVVIVPFLPPRECNHVMRLCVCAGCQHYVSCFLTPCRCRFRLYSTTTKSLPYFFNMLPRLATAQFIIELCSSICYIILGTISLYLGVKFADLGIVILRNKTCLTNSIRQSNMNQRDSPTTTHTHTPNTPQEWLTLQLPLLCFNIMARWECNCCVQWWF